MWIIYAYNRVEEMSWDIDFLHVVSPVAQPNLHRPKKAGAKIDWVYVMPICEPIRSFYSISILYIISFYEEYE